MVNGNAGRLMGCRFDVQRFSAHTVPKQLLMPMGVVNLFRAKLTDDSDEIEPSITIRCDRHTFSRSLRSGSSYRVSAHSIFSSL